MVRSLGMLSLALLVHSVIFGRAAKARYAPPVPLSASASSSGRSLPSTANCTEKYLVQPLDHFSYSSKKATFSQRYFVYDRFWDKQAKQGPIFFYCGNEADVGLYVNATGLIWENAEFYGAYIVFAEHRFYGKSQPDGQKTDDKPYLSHELALADYAAVIKAVQDEIGAINNPVIAFGGSYGGKLAAWMRMKYPATVAGAISASAPLLAFQSEEPKWDSQWYYQVITNSAKHYSSECASNIHASFKMLDKLGSTAAGRQQLQQYFKLCDCPSTPFKVDMLRYFIRDAFDTLAMGNYPWPSNYIGGTAEKPMPAWPMGLACSHLSSPSLKTSPEALFPALRQAVSVLYNVSASMKCFDLPDYPTPLTPGAPMDGLWDWQWCTEQLPDSYWFSTDGKLESGGDMFWPNPYNMSLIEEHCRLAWGVTPRTCWIAEEYGGRMLGSGHSNIVFSSGGFDGWSSGGVATNLSDSLVSIMIPDGGHHLDLMFSHPNDPPSVIAARQLELQHIGKWIADYHLGNRAASWGDRLGVPRQTTVV